MYYSKFPYILSRMFLCNYRHNHQYNRWNSHLNMRLHIQTGSLFGSYLCSQHSHHYIQSRNRQSMFPCRLKNIQKNIRQYKLMNMLLNMILCKLFGSLTSSLPYTLQCNHYRNCLCM